jgi:hypothetical protein
MPIGLGLSPAAALAGPQEPAGLELPTSLERVRAGVEKPKAFTFEVGAGKEPPVARFETRIEVRRYMLSFEEQLHKDLELTPLQRQSQEWASRCCGLDLGVLFKPIERALERRKKRKIGEQIARELEELEAARRK